MRFFLIFVFIIVNCRPSLQIAGDKTPFIIETNNKTCKDKSEFKVWSAFYGTLVITPVNNSKLLEKKYSSYRITQETSITDILISLPLGLILSITRHTVKVENCGKDTVLLSKSEYDKKNNYSQESSFTTELNKSLKTKRASVILKDKKTIQGIIQDFSNKNNQVLVYIKEDEKDSEISLKSEDIESIHINMADLLFNEIK